MKILLGKNSQIMLIPSSGTVDIATKNEDGDWKMLDECTLQDLEAAVAALKVAAQTNVRSE